MKKGIKFFVVLTTLLLTLSSLPTSAKPAYDMGSFGESGTGPGEFSFVEGIVVIDGKIYVTDAGTHQVHVFKTDGSFVQSFNSSGSSAGTLITPFDITTDGTNLYVTDYGNDQVQIFDLDGNYIDHFSVPNPFGIDYYDEKIYVGDYTNDEILVYNASNHNNIDTISGTVDFSEFENLKSMDVHDGIIYAADEYNGTIKTFSAQTGIFLGYFGDEESDFWSEGKTRSLTDPWDVEVKNDLIFVSDNDDKVLVFDLSGTYIKTITADIPTGISFDNQVLYIAENGAKKISKKRLVAHPTDVVARADSDDISLSWKINTAEGITDPVKYDIYRNGSSEFEFIGATSNQYFVDSTHPQNTTTTYQVLAVSEAGESNKVSSNEISLEEEPIQTVTVTETNNSTGGPLGGDGDSFIDDLNFGFIPVISVLMLVPIIRYYKKH